VSASCGCSTAQSASCGMPGSNSRNCESAESTLNSGCSSVPCTKMGALRRSNRSPWLTPQLEVQRLGVEQNAAVAADEYRLAIDE